MSPDRLSTTFAALADPTRRAILARLASGVASVTELGEPFEMSLPAVSKHLKVLERAGLIARGREAQWRPCRLEARPLKHAADWLEHYRRFWEQSFYREIVEPQRLVFTWAWEDAQGKPGHETVVTVTFAEQGGKTKLTLHQATFESVSARDAHQSGWASSLGCLAEYLAKA